MRRSLDKTVTRAVWLLMLLVPLKPSLAQESYLFRIGRPEFRQEQQVELGVLNLANGNLHLEIPVLSITERGGEQFLGSLVYNSHIWRVWDQGSLSGGNIWHSDTGGWRFVASSGGQVQYSSVTNPCPNGPQFGFYTLYNNFVFIAPDGSAKSFSNWTRNDPCPAGTPQSSSTAYASDASGYYLSVTNYQYFKVYAPDGTILTDSAAGRANVDTNGNYTSFPGGVLADQLGRHPYTFTIDPNNHNLQYYDITASDGSTARTTVTYANYNVNTAFGRLQTTEYSGPLSLPQSITLPNGSTYVFNYDSGTTAGHYGELTSITLPTGAQISYAYTTLVDTTSDSYDRRVSSRNSNGAIWSYVPQTIGSCQTGTCTRKVTATDPAGNVSVLTSSYGYYLLSALVYKGPATGTAQRSVTLDYDSSKIRVMRQTTALETGLTSKFEYTYTAPGTLPPNRNIANISDWDYYTGTAPATPTRKTAMTYLATSPYTSRNIIDRVLTQTVSTGGGTVTAQTQLTYDDFALTATSGATGHDYTNYGNTFNTRGNLTQIKKWVDTSNTWLTSERHYDDIGNIVLTKDPALHSTTFSYTDSFANSSCIPAGVPTLAYPTTVTDAAGHNIKTMYFPCTGLKQSVRDDNDINAGRLGTTFSYDKMYRTVSINYPDGGGGTTTFNDTSLPVSSTRTQLMNSASLIRTTVYDGLGRISQTQLHDPDCSGGAGLVKVDYAYGYDPAHNLRFQKSSTPYCNSPDSTYGLMTTINYDVLARVSSIVQTDGGTVSTVYAGNCQTVTDEAGKARKSCTDGLGRLTQVFENPSVLNYETDYQYDILDNLKRVDQKGGDSNSANWRTRLFSYNSLSQLLTASNPESGTVTYTYNNLGNVQTKTAPKPNQTGSATVVTTYTYDAINRLTSKNYNDGSTPQASYFYDQTLVWGATLTNPVGRLTQTAAAGGHAEAVFSYDPMGRVKNQWQCTPANCGVGAFPLAYAYDLAGNLTSASNGAGTTISYQIDGAGRPAQVSSNLIDAQHPATLFTVDPSIGYFPNGALRKATFANGLTQSNVYNNRLQPCLLDVNSSNVTLQTCLDSTPAGNVLDLWMGYGSTNNNGNIQNWNATGVQSFVRTYTYDALNRISTFSDTVAAQPCRGMTWTYDAWGNRSDQTGTVGTCLNFHQSANAQNRLIGFSYDSAGNLLNDGVHSYTYDAENRITQVDGGGTATYVYDVDGRRVSKTAAGIQKDYVYNSEGQVVSEWSLGCGSACWGAGYVYVGGAMLAQYRNGTTYFVHKDHLGSQRVLTDLSHNVYDSLDFGPFGEQTAGDSGTRYKFTGKERDAESGLDNFDFRYYSSVMGRFLKPDDSGADPNLNNPQSLNLYSYVRNNPLRYTDPTGHTCQSNPSDGSTYDDGDGKGCDIVDQQNKQAGPSASVNGCEGAGAVDCLAFMVSDLTSVQSISEVGRNGVQDAMTAEAIWNLPGLIRGWSSLLRSGEMLQGLWGVPVSRAALEAAASSGGETVTVVTNLTSAPAAGKGLSVAVGEGAEALAGAARSGGQTYTAQIPKALISLLEKAGLARESVTDMGVGAAREIRFDPRATEFVAKFFK